MQSCSICNKLQIVGGSLDDYRLLAHYHYLDSRPAPFTAIFALKPDPTAGLRQQAVGVIVYSPPSPVLELRNVATDNFFAGLNRSTQLALINRNIRRISRVIVDPRFRGLGLAVRLVRETMPQMNVPIIEAVAVMGLINPFLEKAGMKAYAATMSVRSLRLVEALSMVGIEQRLLIDPHQVSQRIDRLGTAKAEFVEFEIRHFLKSHGRRRNMQPGIERTRYILSKLTVRPTYYIWFNPKLSVSERGRD
ncbi:MAG: hypothetical protein AMJ75_04425 [Phycisphaerae bacterium SM1_79]|nr:MAG: hypothetical protein AMJ75_04425 [Phycisphaerae bacterium SM1_79]